MQELFVDRLLAAIKEKGSPICVGIDPVYDQLPAAVAGPVIDRDSNDPEAAIDAIFAFTTTVLKTVAPHVPVVKFQSAYFEKYLWEGVEAYYSLIQEAKDLGLLVIGDVKRGDIGSTSSAYAAAHLADSPFPDMEAVMPDAITINPMLGLDAMEPFIKVSREEGKGLFVLVRTSNPGSADFQDVKLIDGRTWSELVADKLAPIAAEPSLIGKYGFSNLGAVVGATQTHTMQSLRSRLPKSIFLLPGYGTQGANGEMTRAAFTNGQGAIVSASRSILYAHRDAKYNGLMGLPPMVLDYGGAPPLRSPDQSVALGDPINMGLPPLGPPTLVAALMGLPPFIGDIPVAAGGSVSIPGVTATITFAAPAGNFTSDSFAAGVTATITFAAPAGLVAVTDPGVTSTITFAAPAGTVSVTDPGTTSSITFAAPVGSASVTDPGATSTITFAAPAGGFSTGSNVSITGTTSTITFAAPAGLVAVTDPGTTSTITFAALAGTASVTIPGTTATITFAAPSGLAAVTDPGTTSTITFAAPSGNFSTGAGVTGTTSTITFSAPGGVASVTLPGVTAGFTVAAIAGMVSVGINGPTGTITFSSPAGVIAVTALGSTATITFAAPASPAGFGIGFLTAGAASQTGVTAMTSPQTGVTVATAPTSTLAGITTGDTASLTAGSAGQTIETDSGAAQTTVAAGSLPQTSETVSGAPQTAVTAGTATETTVTATDASQTIRTTHDAAETSETEGDR